MQVLLLSETRAGRILQQVVTEVARKGQFGSSICAHLKFAGPSDPPCTLPKQWNPPSQIPLSSLVHTFDLKFGGLSFKLRATSTWQT